MMAMMKKIAILMLAAAVVACSKKDNPNPEEPGAGTEIWYPEKSQPGVFRVPDALKNHGNDYAKQTYAGVYELEELVETYNAYFLAPEGTKNTSITPSLGYRFEYEVDGNTVSYSYVDFSSTHRTFELKVTNPAGEREVLITGDWWENWNADDGVEETGKHYGNLRYAIGAATASQTKEFSWKDDGGGNYRVTSNIWKPGENTGLAAKYDYTFNADLSGTSTYRAELAAGGYDFYRAMWEADGSGELVVGEGGNATKHEW